MAEIEVRDNQALEDLIKKVDYVKMEDYYFPTKFALKFINFIKLVNGETGEENKSPLFHYDILDTIYHNKNVLIVSFRGSAKALALDTLLMTPTGHVSMGDVEIGDYVLDRNGKPTKVTHTSEVFYNQTYTITLANGESFVANEDHIHIVQYRTTANNGNTKENKWKEVELTTKELLDKGIYYLSACTEKKPKGRENKYFIPLINKAVEYDSVPFGIDPYTVGVVLGDGHYQRNGQYIGITSSKDDVAELMSYLPYEKNKVLEDKRQPNTVSFGLKGLGHLWDTEVGDFKRENKKIPEGLLYGSVEDRVAVLRGLMDTDGTISENGAYSFSSTSEGLARGVHHIVKSLGGYSRINRYENAYKGYYLVAFNLQDINPFRLKRKADRWVKGKHYLSGSRVAIESIEPTEKPVPSKCISVESDTCSYLIENSIVTHNTALVAEYMILYLAVFGVLDGFGEISVGMYVGDTMDNGVKNLRGNLEFRYNNSEFLQRFIPQVRFTDVEWEFTNAEGHKLCFRGFGASPLTLDTKIPLPNGSFTTMKDVQIGDYVLGGNGKPTKVEVKSGVFNRPVYEIKLLDGRTLKVSDNHLNTVIHKCRNYSKYKDSLYRYENKVLTTKELLEIPLRITGKQEYALFIPVSKPIEYGRKDLPIDPYTLGLLLGDGQLKNDGSCNITAEQNDMDFYASVIPHTQGSRYADKRYNHVHNLSLKGLSNAVKDLGLRGVHTYHKFIPEIYKRSEKEQRLELLKGLMDADGTVDPKNKVSKCTFVSTSEQLAKDVVELVHTLGGYCNITKNKQNKNSLGHADYYRVTLHLNEKMFKLPRKANKQKVVEGYHKNTKIAITAITRISDEPTQCIGVDNEDHLFLAGDYVVTHNTGVRGFKKYGQRPQIAILDDLMSDKSAESKTIIKDIENVIYKAVRQAMHPTRRKVIWIGTPFNKKDPLYKAAGTKAWATKAYPICQKFPCAKADFIGAWEDRFTYEAVKAEYELLKENGRVDAFNQELMLRILSDDDRLVLDEDIVWFKRSDVLDNLHLYNIYITTDFATSESEKADYSVISVWALDWTGRFHWIDGIVKRQDMAINVDDIFRFAELYVPLSTGVEISGQQKGFVSWLKREMINRGIYFMIASDKSSGEEGLRPNTSKLTRFNVALPLFKQRKIAFPEDLKESAVVIEFIEEITSVTPSGFKSLHDDCADTISQLPLIEYFKPTDPKHLRPEDRQPQYNTGRNYFFTEPEEEYKSSYIV